MGTEEHFHLEKDADDPIVIDSDEDNLVMDLDDLHFLETMELEDGEEKEVSFTPIEEPFASSEQVQSSQPKLTDVTSLVDLVTQISLIIKGQQSSIKLDKVLIDTGCSRTIVHKNVVP